MADKKKTKPQGPIRTGAIIPCAIIFALIYLYVVLFLDGHIRRAIEWGGYLGYGAEVNVDNVTTSFWNASLLINRIQLTDHDQPTQNALEISEIRGALIWDALLRGKLVVREAVIENLQMGTPRARPGKVRPPSPEGGFLSREAERLKAEAIARAQEDYNDNILGDFAAIMGGVSASEQLEKIASELKGVVKVEEVEAALKEKEVEWKQRIADLPTTRQLQEVASRLDNVKTSGFGNVKEVEASVREVDAIFKDLEAKRGLIDRTQKNLRVDLDSFHKEIALIEEYIRQDIRDLQKRLNLPSLDAEAISKSLFMNYLGPILARVDEYKELADKYMPPNLKAENRKETDPIIQAHPRAEGTTYSFGRPNSYPLFWLQRAAISSNAKYSPLGGDVSGELTDLTTDQHALGRPTRLSLNGDFPGHEILGLIGNFDLDLRDGLATAFDFKVGSYPMARQQLSDSKDVRLAFNDAIGVLDFKGGWTRGSGFEFQLKNTFENVTWDLEAKGREVQSILSDVLGGIQRVTLRASGKGSFPRIKLDVRSNLGPEIVKGFERVLSARLREAQRELEQYVRGQVDAELKKIQAQYNDLKGQIEGEVEKVMAQVARLEAQAREEKNKAENQARAQIDAEKKKAEAAARKKVEEKGKKAVDDLKKGFGL